MDGHMAGICGSPTRVRRHRESRFPMRHPGWSNLRAKIFIQSEHERAARAGPYELARYGMCWVTWEPERAIPRTIQLPQVNHIHLASVARVR